MSTTHNFPGSILYGHSTNRPIFGRYGKPLYSSSMMEQYGIVEIDWDANDVDICAYWVYGNNDSVGYKHGETTETGNFAQYWSTNDNINGGPEKVAAGVRTGNIPVLARWRVHLNWYRGGPGTATVTIRMKDGASQSITSTVARRTGNEANTSDPGVEITFGPNNSILSMELINQ